MPGREVITLQFGGFANYVGAHYWNLQDELLGLQAQQGPRGPANQVDGDVLFRQGETVRGGGAYTPRLVLWDLSGALGGVSAHGSLYRDADQPGGGGSGAVATWGGGHEVHRAAAVPKSRFLQELEAEAEGEAEDEGQPDEPTALEAAAAELDGAGCSAGGGEAAGGVRFFTDFLKAQLHPRSAAQLAGAWHGLTPLSGWGDGDAHWRSEEQREAMTERVRFFAEESDRLQGFQVLAEDASGWGALAAHVVQELADEYGGRPVMLYALRPDAPAAAGDGAARRRTALNEGLSLALLAPLCASFAVVAPPAPPAALPLLRWQPGRRYHASALCAAALDAATLPYRLAPGEGPHAALGGTDMWGLCQTLAGRHSSPLAALSLALPCAPLPADAARHAARADERLQRGGGGAQRRAAAGGADDDGEPFITRWLAGLTPGVPAARDAGRLAESVVLRGPRAGGAPLELPAAAAALDAALAAERQRCVRLRTLVAAPLPVPLPFPHLFARGLSRTGDPPAAGRLGAGSQDVASCPVLTRLSSTSSLAPLVTAARRRFLDAASAAQGEATLESWGLGREEAAEAGERLARLAHAYDEES